MLRATVRWTVVTGGMRMRYNYKYDM